LSNIRFDSYDQAILYNECDFVFKFDTHNVVLEVDEFAHTNNNESKLKELNTSLILRIKKIIHCIYMKTTTKLLKRDFQFKLLLRLYLLICKKNVCT